MIIKQISIFMENTTGRLADVTALLAQAGDELKAIHVRQAQIDDGDIDGVVGRVVQRHLGIVRAVNLVLGLGQQGGEVVIEQLVVFNQ